MLFPVKCMRHEQIHIHQRKRQTNKELHSYPSSKPLIRLVDNIISITSVIYPLALLPQLFQIWLNKSAEGVSLFTWSLLLLFTIPLMGYAFLHKDKRLTIMYCAFFVIYIIIIIGIVLFG